MKLFVYEFLCAGGLKPDAPASLRQEGWAMLSALVEDFDRVPDVETLTLLDEALPGSLGQVCRRTNWSQEPHGFREVLSQANLALVIAPELDGHLHTRCRWVLESGQRLLGSTLPAIDLASDKLALATHLARHGIPTPATNLLAASTMETRFPAVCKPRYGAGSQATSLVQNTEELAIGWQAGRAELATDDFVVQPYVTGQPASVLFLIGPEQSLALPACTQSLSTDGRFHYLGGRAPLHPALAERAGALARRAVDTVAGLAGFCGVDLVLGNAEDGRGDQVIEINPRVTTSYVGLRRLIQDNLADLLLRIMRGEHVPPVRCRAEPVHFSAAAPGQTGRREL